MSDHDLLQRYARAGDQAAFTELVARHLNLVYSAARRQVHPPQLAEDVTQSVFLDLARRARDFPSGQPLSPWLHVVTRRTAIDVIRRESRRHAREQTALEIAAMNTPDSSWSHLEPLLDEAVAALRAPDRTALVLRFFENKNLREIGTALGTNEDAAQKRVSRALDQLRTLLVRRGLPITAAGLATNLSAHAILTAPAALVGTISASVIATLPVAALVGAQTLAMTTLQKSLAASLLALGLGAGLYEATIYARQTSDLATLTSRETDLTAQLRSTRTQHAALTARLKSVEAQIDARLAASNAHLASGDAALEAEMKLWLTNRDRLKQLLDERPHLRIPEMALLKPEAWFQAAAGAKLDSDEGIRRALANLRNSAETLLIYKIQPALRAYLKAHDDTLPDQIAQLLPLIDPPIAPALLDRYEILRSGKLSEGSTQNQMDIIGLKNFVDLEYDTHWRIGSGGFAATSAMSQNLTEARRAFSTANPGQKPASDAELLPYMKWPTTADALERHQKASSTYPR